jgi:hypothetical protein
MNDRDSRREVYGGCRLSARITVTTFAIIAVCCIIHGAPAAAQLRFRKESTHAALWRHVYSQLPAAWKAHRIIYVREIPDDEMDQFVERIEGQRDQGDAVVDGCYQGPSDGEELAGLITLRESLRGENAGLVFVHEFGHYVWSNILTGADRTRYRRLWREQKRYHSLVTDYAADSDEEGFAEAFAYFIRRPATLHRLDARSWRFLHEVQDREPVDLQDADIDVQPR